ncbi:MAG: hypothetical protein KDD53_11975, partial [Bdellovibrionales bacterium]|nr:hypothetical protein [Bdellovibrionales bacterium]
VAVSPDNSFALGVLGFVELTRYNTVKAKEYFGRALSLDENVGLFHLGMGLALIREGQLEAGSEELKIAVVLEPNRSIFRSYLGKAFFEDEREDLAAQEYDRAIALDPNDPTPYLYRAYHSLSQNRLVDSLRDVQKSIDLNDNRAVYRSKLLLDQDSAVRSAGLAEIYNQLGFSRLARIEAIKSLNRNYGNYSAHRFLADSYNTTILTADAGRSERNVAELLAPLSFNFFNNPGTEAGFNEYNALFERDEVRTSLGGRYNTQDDTMVPEAFVAGQKGKVGYATGYQSAYTGGSRDNNYSYDHRVKATGQYQATYSDRFILNSSYQSLRREESNATFDDQRFEDHEISAGYHRRLGPDSRFIMDVTHRDNRSHFGGNNLRFIEILAQSKGEQFSRDDELLLREFSREN